MKNLLAKSALFVLTLVVVGPVYRWTSQMVELYYSAKSNFKNKVRIVRKG